MSSSLQIISSRRFLPLFITQFFGAFNDNAFKNALLVWFVYDTAQKFNLNIPVLIGTASALFILPFFLFSALAGQLADKYSKPLLARIIKLCEIIIMVLSFAGFYFENIFLLMSLLFLMGAHSAFFGPIKYSLPADHLKDNELLFGNAAIEAGTFLAILLGTIFGGVFIRAENGFAIVSISLTFFAVVGWLASRFIPAVAIDDKKLQINFNVFSATAEIINYAKNYGDDYLKLKNSRSTKKSTNQIWQSIIGISVFWFIGAIFVSLFPLYAKNLIHGNEFIVTLFLTMFSIGIGVGSFLCSKILRGKINFKLVPYGFSGIIFGTIIFIFASYFYNLKFSTSGYINNDGNYLTLIGIAEFLAQGIFSWVICASLMLIAIAAGIYIVPLYATMQHYAKAKHSGKYLARIIAANNVMNALFMVVASLCIMAASAIFKLS